MNLLIYLTKITIGRIRATKIIGKIIHRMAKKHVQNFIHSLNLSTILIVLTALSSVVLECRDRRIFHFPAWGATTTPSPPLLIFYSHTKRIRRAGHTMSESYKKGIRRLYGFNFNIRSNTATTGNTRLLLTKPTL